jgi:hypothetical protein
MVAIGVVGFVVWAHHMYTAGYLRRDAGLLRLCDDGHRGADGREDLLVDRDHVGRLDPVPHADDLGAWLHLPVHGRWCDRCDARQRWCRPFTLHNTYYVVAHFHYVLSLGAVFASSRVGTTGSRKSPATSTPSSSATCTSAADLHWRQHPVLPAALPRESPACRATTLTIPPGVRVLEQGVFLRLVHHGDWPRWCSSRRWQWR